MHVRDIDRRATRAVHRQARRADCQRAADETVEMPWPGANRTNDAPDRPDAATVLRWQQTVGNQVVQRLLQRDDEVFRAPSEWEFEPKPVTETDSTYDTEDEKRRAEQKAADERGESPKPNEWWKNKPPQPKPTDPKSYEDLQKQIGQGKSSDSGGGGGIDFGPLPPAEEQQPGDYPLTPAIEPEDAAYA